MLLLGISVGWKVVALTLGAAVPWRESLSVDREQTNTEECGGMSARVRAYTFFAIPYSDVRTVCDRGVMEYRVFRRWNR